MTDNFREQDVTFLTLRDLERRWKIGRTTLCSIINNASDFPAAMMLPGMGAQRSKRWRLEDIIAFEGGYFANMSEGE